MSKSLRKSGIEVLGDISWGTHFCQFYETKKDLLELLVPYFKAGLENNEFCLWITSDPVTVENAFEALRQAIPSFDQYFKKKSIEILPYTEWYLKTGKFNGKIISDAWLQKLSRVLERGYDGMRVNGNETWLENEDWDNFMKYEEELNKTLLDRRMILLCTYPLPNSPAGLLLDVAHAHECVISKRKGKWEILEEPEIKKVKAQLKRKTDELELQVAERTRELRILVDELRKEIDERKQAEAKFKIVVEQSLLGFYIISRDKFVYVNPKLAEIFGYEQHELIDSKVEKVIHPDDREMVAEHVRVRMEGEQETVHYEAKGLKKNGETVIIEVFCSGILKEKTTTIMGTLLDITERKRTELLINSERKLSNEIINSIPGLFALFDENLRFIRWNKNFEIVSGYTPEEILTLHGIESFFDNEKDKKRAAGILAEIFEKGSGSGEISSLMKDRKPIELFFIGRSFKHEGRTYLITTGIDIGKRKRAEEELKLAYKRLSYHVENTPLAVIEWDKDLFITRWSGQAEQIFGWRASEVVGKNMYDPDVRLLYEEDIPKIRELVSEFMQGLMDRNLSLNRNYTKDRKVIYCEWYNSVLKNDQGEVVTILSLTHDITERKEAEEKLNQSYHRIRSLSEHLQNIREEERKRISREIHDELGQQLTVMKLDVSWLIKRLSTAEETVNQKLGELKDLLDTTVVSVRRISSELRPSLLDDLGLTAAMEWHLKEFESRSGIQTSFNAPEEEWQLSDSVKTGLFRIFQESLTNVARHSEAKAVKVDFRRQNGHLVLQIKDNGKGFDKKETNEKKTLGILGMKERTASMGGNYEIESKPEKGTTVTVNLPFKNINSSKP
jgi:PAS domain S-box-containing protein